MLLELQTTKPAVPKPMFLTKHGCLRPKKKGLLYSRVFFYIGICVNVNENALISILKLLSSHHLGNGSSFLK